MNGNMKTHPVYDVVVTFKDGRQLNGRCIGDPIACTPAQHHSIFDRPFLFLDTGTGYRAMIRTEDICMIQAKKVTEE